MVKVIEADSQLFRGIFLEAVTNRLLPDYVRLVVVV